MSLACSETSLVKSGSSLEMPSSVQAERRRVPMSEDLRTWTGSSERKKSTVGDV